MKLISLTMAKYALEVADKIGITGASGTFQAEEIITGGTSSATGKVVNVQTAYLEVVPLTGTFVSGETITGGLSGETATTSYVTGRYDTVLTTFIEQISARIEKFLNRSLKKEARTEYFDAGDQIYSLKAYPVDTGETFTVTLNDDAMTINEDFYLHDEEGIIDFITGTGTRWPRGLVVAYQGGYAEGADGVLAVPDDLKSACLLQVMFEFNRRRDIGLSSVNMGDGSVAVYQPADWLPVVKKSINAYRRIPV